MSKSVLISIKPKWCEKIANGQKTIEVRKTEPKLKPPFRCYIYCTAVKGRIINYENGMLCAEDELAICDGKIVTVKKPFPLMGKNVYHANKKVIGEFVCDKIESFTTDYRMNKEQTDRISKESFVCYGELLEYEGNSPCLFGWHISDLKIYDKPKVLSEFYSPNYKELYKIKHSDWKGVFTIQALTPIQLFIPPEPKLEDYKIKKAPQSWCYVEELQEGQ